MAGAASVLPAATGPQESEGGRWWPPVGDFGLGAVVWPAVARLGLGMVVLQSEPSSRYRCSKSAYRNIILLSSQSGQIAPKTAIISMAYGRIAGIVGNIDFGRRGGRQYGCRCKRSNSLGRSTARSRAARTAERLAGMFG